MEKHILICGERGVGKSTLIRRVRQHPCGEVFYITPESREALYQRLRSRILQWNKEKL